MEVAILSTTAANFIGCISSEAVKEIGFLWGVSEDLSGLEDTISIVRAVLLDTEKKQGHSNQVSTWLKRLEDVVYEADDLKDEFNTETGNAWEDGDKKAIIDRLLDDKMEENENVSVIYQNLAILMDQALQVEKLAAITVSSTADEKSFYKAWERSNRLSLMFMRMTVATNIETALPKTEVAKEFMKFVEERSQSDKSLGNINGYFNYHEI
ncbi:hypothetical protein FNV43_RR25187 [Rhamnella rubrinervis]|uniref:Disease resistance N-terminal domain-containing protein n=1 Tax=Rhamnella rubrinervis TaxID=2594499 RepID=A0A8K0DTQ3_9ROSA|nr:hypothetical protein FNV43_RR25187 [Rhamnella rubrinervis]